MAANDLAAASGLPARLSLVLSDGAMSESDHPNPQPVGASLWTSAASLYGAPGVAEACLALQDRYACDVNVLLFATWMGVVHHHTFSSVELVEAAAAVQDWHWGVRRPRRSVTTH